MSFTAVHTLWAAISPATVASTMRFALVFLLVGCSGQVTTIELDAGDQPDPIDAGDDIDSGSTDSRIPDAGPLDAGPIDAGPIDAGPIDAGPAPLIFGTLIPNASRALTIADAGIRTVELVISWRDYEKTRGDFDPDYIAARNREIAAFRAAGITPTLSFSHHYTPTWVCALPGAYFVDQNAATYCGRPYNLVFSQPVRDALIEAIEHIASDFGAANFGPVRVQTAGVAGEVSYPKGGTYWAYDANASGGTDGPSTIPPRPFPTWKPGNTSLSTADTRTWLTWYVSALADAVDFQVRTYQRLGFSGPFHPVQPGHGVRPIAYEAAIANHLASNTLLGQGVAWYQVFGHYQTRAVMTAYTSSLAEGATSQPCLPTDAALPPTSPLVDAFDSGRFMAWVGAQYGVRGAGENPGCCGSSYGTAMLPAAVNAARSCHFSHLYWAHEDNLFENGAHGVSLQRLAAEIAAP